LSPGDDKRNIFQTDVVEGTGLIMKSLLLINIIHLRHINICWLFGSSVHLRIKDDEVFKSKLDYIIIYKM